MRRFWFPIFNVLSEPSASSSLRFSFLVNMNPRKIGEPVGIIRSAGSVDSSAKQLELCSSDPSYDLQWPSLSSACSKNNYRNFSQRNTREEKAKGFGSETGSLLVTNATHRQDEMSLPTHVVIKSSPPSHTSKPKLFQTSPNCVAGNYNPNCSKNYDIVKTGENFEYHHDESCTFESSPHINVTSQYGEDSQPLLGKKPKPLSFVLGRKPVQTCSKNVTEDINRNGAKNSDMVMMDTNLQYHDVSSTRPTHFRRKRRLGSLVKKPQFRPTSRKNVRGNSSSDCLENLPLFKPFDICETNIRNGTVLHSRIHVEQDSIKHTVEGAKLLLRPGMALLKGFIPFTEQIEIVKKCRDLGLGPGGFYQPGFRGGAKLRLQMMCFGLSWDPETRKYHERRPIDGAKTPDIPEEFGLLVRKAIHGTHALLKEVEEALDVEEILPSMSPDICIVNFYTTSGKLGLHQDRDESRESLRKGLPVVSVSIGDSADFLYGDQRDVEKAEKIVLESGDVLIFGGKSRHIFHGVPSIIPNSAPEFLIEEAYLRPGRLNLTFRQY